MKTAADHPRVYSSRLGWAALLSIPLLFLPLSCTLTTDLEKIGPLPTILVTNNTCSSGVCTPLEIRAFPTNQPRTPGGYWSIELGTVSGETACLTLNRADTFRVIGLHEHAPPDTTYVVWRVGDSISLGAVEPGTSLFHVSPETEPFVPTGGSGWRVTLPGSSTVSSAGVCG